MVPDIATDYIKPFGTIYLNLIKMVVVPVVFLSIMQGIVSLQDVRKVASIGTTGVSGAGMVMLAMVLESVGLPLEGIALVAGIDRILDMGRTTVNVVGCAACTMCVDAWAKKREAKKTKQPEIST